MSVQRGRVITGCTIIRTFILEREIAIPVEMRVGSSGWVTRAMVPLSQPPVLSLPEVFWPCPVPFPAGAF